MRARSTLPAWLNQARGSQTTDRRSSISLAPAAVGQSIPSFTVLFTGVREDATTVTQLLTVQNLYTGTGQPLLQTSVFSGFANLTSVSMTQGVLTEGTSYQFTNLVVNAQSVPDTASTIGLLGIGLAGLTGIAHRVRQGR